MHSCLYAHFNLILYEKRINISKNLNVGVDVLLSFKVGYQIERGYKGRGLSQPQPQKICYFINQFLLIVSKIILQIHW